ncbi:MAG: hypothetical protein BroJett039_13200 [Chloroflexota bacterium]|nr:MAG: hypothetical protein BroJett039_13200 [Chloroflexota bacterium]
MEHGHVTTYAHTDPSDLVAEEARIKKANPNYIGVFVILGILTAIEIGLTTLFENTIGRVPILLALTVAKALLVVLYYMHLKFDSKLYAGFFGVGVFVFALPYVLSMVALLAPIQLVPVREAMPGAHGGEAAARPTRNPNAGPPLALNMEAGDYFFKPDAFDSNSGQIVRLTINNSGSVEHNFTLAGVTKDKSAEPWKDPNITSEVVAHALAGSTGKGNFTAPAPGEYVFFCSIPGHAELGMHGTVVIK